MPGPITKLLSTCSGLVLDIGPGSGEQLRHFTPSRITAAYGAEPAADLHPKLISTAEKVGFAGGKYHALLCGAEPESLIPALHKNGLLATAKSGTGGGAAGNSAAGSEVFDEICSVRVLCGVPRPRETVKGLYELLKPGGRLVVCEHVVNQRSAFARGMQMLYMLLGWSFFMGGCELQRDTERFLREAGEWERVEIEQVGSMDTIPYIVGELFKKER
ncbi:hypothetical protein BU24DRAFT_420017 [Aaosphaeria arxii CBS 175.79]|uniref:S-adenosyl-L-methionine-dependent methyltransferase n=1 Tax=Aaosphaeria arxii CBS 175.79 TaxID=1450172 RepID=A0A6A5XXG6_9PLEO|nr:uncharacterized protein BU24DRAFT_420017 [Aaosphaeria arxii CBS 175.79]KAF2016974.1 hypothetical protein BU24DRAFT_420017 [Aaosphaeria arxii CBS 175.79]